MADPQLLKGALSLLLLAVAREREDYGYSVVARLRERGLDGLGEGTVYPALTRLEAQGLLSSRLVPSPSGPARKYYAITAAGERELARLTDQWRAIARAVRLAAPETEETP